MAQERSNEDAKIERALSREKRQRRSKWLTYAVIMMAVIYYGDVVGLDVLVYGLTGFIDGIFDTTWLPSVKASFGTLKFFGFGAAALFAFYMSKQEV